MSELDLYRNQLARVKSEELTLEDLFDEEAGLDRTEQEAKEAVRQLVEELREELETGKMTEDA